MYSKHYTFFIRIHVESKLVFLFSINLYYLLRHLSIPNSLIFGYYSFVIMHFLNTFVNSVCEKPLFARSIALTSLFALNIYTISNDI